MSSSPQIGRRALRNLTVDVPWRALSGHTVRWTIDSKIFLLSVRYGLASPRRAHNFVLPLHPICPVLRVSAASPGK
eukprot:1884216-Pyramimonas_sp.AAC.1